MNIFVPGGSASMPALIAPKASSSGTGVGFQVIIMSPCCGGRACGREHNADKQEPKDRGRRKRLDRIARTYRDFRDGNARGRAAEVCCVVYHDMLGSTSAPFRVGVIQEVELLEHDMGADIYI
jgi:hypothetical protein